MRRDLTRHRHRLRAASDRLSRGCQNRGCSMRKIRTLLNLTGLAFLVGLDLVRPSRAEYRLPARWLAR